MPDRSRQKERKRLKRKRKQESLRKIASISPFRAISRLPAEVQCWTNSNWKQTRQASIFVLRQTRSGRCAVANFLVDFGVAGLKDVWGRFDLTSTEFFDEVLEPFRKQFPVEQIEPAAAGHLVAGGIRFAHDNGFRLPHRYDRWLSLLGEIGDWHHADVSDFEMEFAGSMDELRRRLIGQSIHEFLARKDIRIILSNDAPSLLQDQDLTRKEMGAAVLRQTAENVRELLIASSQTPSPLLDRAVDIFAQAMVQGMISATDKSGEKSDPGQPDATLYEALAELILLEPPEDREELEHGVVQVATALAAGMKLRNPPQPVG